MRGQPLARPAAGLLLAVVASSCMLLRPLPKPIEPWTSPTGLVVYDLLKPEGRLVEPGDWVRVHYELRLADGSVLDSSWDRGLPLSFRVGDKQVIAGFEEAVTGMAQGGIRKVLVPPDLGYGEAGVPPVIPPATELTFEIEMMNVTPNSTP